MTDIHCHLVPGVDDGSRSPEQTKQILELMQQIGIKRVITTPHIFTRYPQNNGTSLKAAFEELLPLLPSHLPELHLGAEYMVDSAFLDQLQGHPLLTLGRSPYLLCEFSFASAPFGYERLLSNVSVEGAVVLLAHPERFLYLGDREYDSLKAQGCRFQLNLFSLTGMYGPQVAKRAAHLFALGMYDFVGTDTHRPEALTEVIASAVLPKKYEAPLRALIERNDLLFQ